MTLPYMPFYIDDFEAATTHLTFAEDGAYNRLIRLCWRTNNCSVPNDHDWIMRRMRASQEEFDTIIKPIIDEFFTIKKGRIIQNRLKSEYGKAISKNEARKTAGKKGGDAKALKSNKNTSSKANDLLLAKSKQSSSNQNQNHISKKTNKKTKILCPEDWSPSDELYKWATQHGLSQDEVNLEIEKFAAYFTEGNGEGTKRPGWDASFKTWIRNHKKYSTEIIDKKADEDGVWNNKIRYWFENNDWPMTWGYPPDQRNHQVPPHIMKSHGLDDPNKKMH